MSKGESSSRGKELECVEEGILRDREKGLEDLKSEVFSVEALHLPGIEPTTSGTGVSDADHCTTTASYR